ncbi:MAG: HAMP domain-containing protein, partial [Zetaproteobacteria bacterium]
EVSVLILAAMAMYFALRHAVTRELDQELSAQLAHLAEDLRETPAASWPDRCRDFSAYFLGGVRVLDLQNRVLCEEGWRMMPPMRSMPWPRLVAQAVAENAPQFAYTASMFSRRNARVVVAPLEVGGRIQAVVVLAHSTADIAAMFRLLFALGAVIALASMLLIAVAGYALAKRALRPLDAIRRTAMAVAAGDLSRRVEIGARGEDDEIRQLVRALHTMFDRLEQAFQAQKRFTADASHELRLPLTILRGEVEYALRRPRSPEEYRKALQSQLEILAELEQLVEDLLTLARADAHELEVAQETVDLALLLREVAQDLLPLFARKKIELELDVDEELETVGDERALMRVFRNLLHNAYKYAPEGTRVRVRAHREGAWAVVFVEDQGPGAPEEALKHIFDRFYRVDGSRAKATGGFGLGLAICKEIVSAHGGEIRAENIPEGGMRFIVRLPAAA